VNGQPSKWVIKTGGEKVIAKLGGGMYEGFGGCAAEVVVD
jgi:hypothetical protein